MSKFTPGPWKWQGEDYRGDWGWMLLVGPNGEGIACGEGKDGPYEHLRSHMAIEAKYCQTGWSSDDESAPCLHVRQADAQLIAAAPDLYDALDGLMQWVDESSLEQNIPLPLAFDDYLAILAKARGDNPTLSTKPNQ
jgi:hypothetical protein